jgi:small subunit ribosomal protein S6
MTDEDVDKVVATVDHQITSAGGTVKSVDKMGKRRLAYLVRNFADGLYILVTIEGPGSAISEVERRLRVTEPVIKFITVRVDEEQKRLGKVKAIRDSRRRGMGTHAQAAAEAQTAEPPAEQAPAQA